MLLISACDTPERVLKSNDLDYKIQTATRWYNKKQYVKCIPVFEELMGLLKGTKSTENIYYMYCWANYRQGDYLIAAYHFNNFVKLNPNSPKAEECSYMSAKSHEKLSPRYTLDQTNTFKAIESFQEFVNDYPESGRVDTANMEFQLLKKKLETKSLKNAELYYKTENYKAGATAFKNLLIDYPDVDNPDYVYYMIVKSYDKYAENSISAKKAERYRDVTKAYYELKYRFPNSKYLVAAQKMADASHWKAALGAYEYAASSRSEEKGKALQAAIQEIQGQQMLMTDEKEKIKSGKLLERSYYNLLKHSLTQAEDAKLGHKTALYEQSIKNYYTFVDKFKDGKYAKNAEKAFLLASDKLKKLKENGQEQKN